MDARTRLDAAFKEMRQRGLIARQNLACCKTCGGYEATQAAEKLVRAGKRIIGCAFYHAQDAADRDAGKDFYLAYGEMESEALGDIGLPTEQVGQIVVAILTKHGIGAVWDGSPGKRIQVLWGEAIATDVNTGAGR